MKVLLDIGKSEASAFMKMVKTFSTVKTESISAPDAALFAEIKHIKKAFKIADGVKRGKIATRSATDFLNEL